jgi:hypothetical protein
MGLSDTELIQLEELIKQRAIDQKRQSLLLLEEGKTAKNYMFLRECFERQRYEGDKLVEGKKGVVLEGGARSRKTFSWIDFLIWYCLYYANNKTIIIIRETYNSFKTTLFTDMEKALDEFGLDNPFKRAKDVESFRIRKNKIHFKGADNPTAAHGAPSDLLYFNEMLPIPRVIFKNYTMRCAGFWVGDFNPSVTQHWIFDEVIPRKDIGHLRTTFLDNPQCPIGMKIEIMGYEPFLPGSYDIVNDELWYNGAPIDDHNQPPPHPDNDKTANLFEWKVYGLGLRGAMQGVIFKNIRYIDKFPDMGYIYVNDFGFTSDPNSFGKYAETETDIFVELLIYEPVETPELLDSFFTKLELDRQLPMICDSSDKYTGENKGTVEMVIGLQNLDWNAIKVQKNKSVMYWLLSMKNKRVNIVKNHMVKHAKKEAENYKFKEIDGIFINQPIDQFNHFWDMTRYGHMAWNSSLEIETEWN